MRNWQGVAVMVLAFVVIVLANYLSQLPTIRQEREEKKQAAEMAAKKAEQPKPAEPKVDRAFGAKELKAIGAGANPAKFRDIQGSVVTIRTDRGDIVVQLLDRDAPITVDNFLRLAAAGFYSGLVFHRVEPGFVIQTGDPVGTGMGGPGWTVPDEIHANNRFEAGTVGMANLGPNTGGSQFFVCLRASPHLDKLHTAFGRVLKGMDVAKSISVGDAMVRITIEKHWVPTTSASTQPS